MRGNRSEEWGCIDFDILVNSNSYYINSRPGQYVISAIGLAMSLQRLCKQREMARFIGLLNCSSMIPLFHYFQISSLAFSPVFYICSNRGMQEPKLIRWSWQGDKPVELSALVVIRLCQYPPYNFTEAACASRHNTQTYLTPWWPENMSGRGAGYLVSKLFRLASPGTFYEGTGPEFVSPPLCLPSKIPPQRTLCCRAFQHKPPAKMWDKT
jgi:hypothetical protein